ncbi:hypothetical protein BCT33_08910 [Vibrio lentus]|nr:hypothetical protein BCU14_13630 [Vibrio lentus]PMN35748.1 hypothetical protein BCT33_08910 [Vibrio lentus]PMN58404.1 hypothetical protein BCT29_06400 [Vibrio lentus]
MSLLLTTFLLEKEYKLNIWVTRYAPPLPLNAMNLNVLLIKLQSGSTVIIIIIGNLMILISDFIQTNVGMLVSKKFLTSIL